MQTNLGCCGGTKMDKKTRDLFHANKCATFFIFLFFFPVISILVEKVELDKLQDLKLCADA